MIQENEKKVIWQESIFCKEDIHIKRNDDIICQLNVNNYSTDGECYIMAQKICDLLNKN